MKHLKRFGYLISIISVVLLAIPPFNKAKEDPLALTCLILGALLSAGGQIMRWASFEIEQRQKHGERSAPVQTAASMVRA